MKYIPDTSRRILLKSSLFGLILASVPNILFAKDGWVVKTADLLTENSGRYPAIDEAVVAEVVGVSHFNLERLQELVNPRPELARATWDWGFGDWETALGAASHTGRKDIVAYLLSKGARPDIFTFAMLGHFSVVKTMIETLPGIQKIAGPHGISLLQHAKNGITESSENKTEALKLIAFLESLGDADSRKYADLDEKEKPKYLGDYKYGEGATDGFSVKLNMRKIITLGKLGKSGGALLQIGDHIFTYNGTPSVTVSFQVENGQVISLTVTEPGLTLLAKKIR